MGIAGRYGKITSGKEYVSLMFLKASASTHCSLSLFRLNLIRR